MTTAISKIKAWRKDPVLFVRDNFKVEPDEWQRDVLSLIKAQGQTKIRKRIAMKACTGPGKSAVLSWGAWYRLSCFGTPGHHPKGAALSGEGRDNLRDNLWAELGKWQGRSEFLTEQFTWNKEQIYNNDYPETWFLSARSYPKDADADAIGRSLSGLHSEYPFVLLDEIGDMPIQVGKKAEQIFTGGTIDGLVLAAGNPTSTSGLLYDVAVNQRENWDVITITSDPDDPKRTPRVDIDHARQMIKTYGRNDPWVQATILGEFPASGLNQLLTIDEVDLAMRRKNHLHDYENAQKRLGIDVARLGMDSTVIFPRQGLQAFQPVEMRGARNPEIAARVALAKSRWNSEVEFIDGTGGFGAGVVDALIQSGYNPYEIHFSSKAEDSRFFNKRSEMWFRMAEWVKRGGALPTLDRLRKELSTPLYSFKNGKFILEEKDQLKKRLGYSPDMADALALTFAMAEMPTLSGELGLLNKLSSQRSNFDYNPFEREDNYNPFKASE